MKLNANDDTGGVSRREFLAGGLVSLALAATHAEALAPIDSEPAKIPSSLLDVDLRRLVSRADLDYDTPTERSEDGMPVGNGTMGSLVWTTPEAMHFQINRCDVHGMGASSYSFPRFSTDYASGCGYVDISFVDFGEEVFTGPSFRQHLNVYDAVMTARGSGVTVRVLAWADEDVIAIEIDDQRAQLTPINIDLRMLRFTTPFVWGRNFELATQHTSIFETNAHTATSRLNIQDGRIVLTQAFEEGDYDNGSAVVIGSDGRKSRARYLNESTVRLSVAPGRGRFTVYIATAAGKVHGEDLAAAAGKKLDAATSLGFAGLSAANRAWWHNFWSRGFLRLTSSDGAAEYVEQHYTYFLYVMAASSRGSYPPRFAGMLWFTNGDMSMWGSEHWWNNDGCYYEGLLPANRPELVDPVFRMYSGNFPSFAEAAKKQWGSEGVWIPETTWFDGLEKLPDDLLAEMQELYLMRKPWEQRSENFRRYANAKQMCNSRWNFELLDGKWEVGNWVRGDYGKGPFGPVTHIFSTTAKISYIYWLRYDLTRDEAFLRDSAYPMLRGTIEFYRNFPNTRKEADGKYHIYHSNNFEGIRDVQDTQEDLSAIRGIAPLVIRASKILGVDAEMRPVWQEFLDNLCPLPTNETIGARKAGEPLVWVGTATPGKRGPVELPTAFYDLCTQATEDAEMLALGNATYDVIVPEVNEKTPCPTCSRVPVSAAKLGRPEHLRYLLPNLLKRLVPVGDDCDWEGVGKVAVLRNRLGMREGPGCIEYERGGILARALHAALLMDVPPSPGKDEVLQVFATWPKEWDAEFTLVGRGAFVVTSAVKSGQVEFVELKSQAGGDCRLRNPWQGSEITIYRNGRQAENLSGSQLQFATAKEEVLLVLRKGTSPAQFKRSVA
jgi:hypothetical protein